MNELMKLITDDINRGSIKILKKNINVLTIEEKTSLLTVAALSNSKNILLLLLNNGADIHYAFEEYNHPLILSLRYNILKYQQDNISDILIDSGIDVTVLECSTMFVAAVVNNFDMLKKIIKKGADIHARENTLVLSVASSGNVKMMQYILDAGVPIRDDGRELRIAVNHGHLDMVRFLIEQGCLIDSKNEDGHDAIQCAAMFGHIDIVQHLLNHGANIESVIKYFDNPKDPFDPIFLIGKKASTKEIMQEWCVKYIERKKLNDILEDVLISNKASHSITKI